MRTERPLISRREFLCCVAAGMACGTRRGDGATGRQGEERQEPSSRTPCSPSASLRGVTTPSPARPVADLAALKDALEKTANPGDVILLQPGVYLLDSSRLAVRRSGTPKRPITLRGVVLDGRRPVLDGSRVNVDRGLLYFPPETHDWVVENLELRNARGSGRSGPAFSNNAAAAYIRGTNLTFRNCYSHHNDNGWFSTDDAVNTLLEGGETAYNGKPPDAEGNATHNHYVNSRSLTVRGCYIHHSTDGQNFKSRCEHAVLAYNWIEEDGNYSVEVASGNARNTLWIGNVIIKRSSPGGQRRLLGVGDGTEVARGTLTLIHNTLVTQQPEDQYFFSHPSATTDLLLFNNLFSGPGRTLFDGNGSGRIQGAGNFVRTGLAVPPGLAGTIVSDDPGFVDAKAGDLHLRAGSPCRDAGIGDPRSRDDSGHLVRTMATHEPRRRHAGATRRRSVGKPDIGAFEYVP